MKKAVLIVLLVIVSGYLGYLLGSMNVESKSLAIFAGTAFATPGREIIELFEEATGVKIEVQWGGSGRVLSSLKISKYGDIFLSGSHDFMLMAINDGVVSSNVKVIAYLVPAIIVPKGNPKNITCLKDLAKPGVRVGMADPDYVCIGIYAREVLEHNGLWDEVSPNIVVHADSCEGLAALVAIGSVDAVIGWHVFHYWNPDKTDIVWLEPHQIPKISFICAALTKYCRNKVLAELFLDFIANSEVSKEIMRRYGYLTLEEVRNYAPYAEVPRLTPR